MKQIHIAILLLIACTVIGCQAKGRSFTEVRHGSGEAVIYVYRHGEFQGSAVTFKIKVDDELVGKLKPNGYVYATVPPGRHLVSCKTEAESTVEINARPNGTYYIESETVMGFWMGRPKLFMVDPEIGRANIGGKKYSGKEPADGE